MEARAAPPEVAPPWAPALVALVLVVAATLGVSAALPRTTARLTLERASFDAQGIHLHVRNDGPPFTIAQVMVNRAFRAYTGPRTVPARSRGVIVVPYPWEEGTAHVISLFEPSGKAATFFGPTTFRSEVEKPSLAAYAALLLAAAVPALALAVAWPLVARMRPESAIARLVLGGAAGTLAALAVTALDRALRPGLQPLGAARTVEVAFAGVVAGVLLGLWALRDVDGDEGSRRSAAALASTSAAAVGAVAFAYTQLLRSAVAAGTAAIGRTVIVATTAVGVAEGLALAAVLARRRVKPSGDLLFAVLAMVFVPPVLGLATGQSVGWARSPGLALGAGAGILCAVLWCLAQRRRTGPAPWDRLTGVGFVVALVATSLAQLAR